MVKTARFLSFVGIPPPKLYRQYNNINNDDIYFNSRFKSWGWATWRDRWQAIDWRIKGYYSLILNPFKIQALNRSSFHTCIMLRKYVKKERQEWGAVLSYNNLKNNKVCVFPVHSHINNIGHDGTGVNCGITKMYDNDLQLAAPIQTLHNNVNIDRNIMKILKAPHTVSIKRKVILFLKIYINESSLLKLEDYVKRVRIKLHSI